MKKEKSKKAIEKNILLKITDPKQIKLINDVCSAYNQPRKRAIYTAAFIQGMQTFKGLPY